MKHDTVSNNSVSEKTNAPLVTYVTAKDSEKLVRKNFNSNQITVARLGHVWAAFWRATEQTSTEKVYNAKGRPQSKSFSVLGPINLLQALVDWEKVLPNYVDLLRNDELLLKAIADKLFLRFPISASKKKKLGLPDCVVSKEVHHESGEEFYVMHLISGEGADYGYIQEAICPSSAVSVNELTLSRFIDNHLIAITSWNKSGKGSNYDDFEAALEMCIEVGVPLMIKQSPDRGKAMGSYGVIDVIDNEYLVQEKKTDSKSTNGTNKKRNKVVRQAALEDKYWHGILTNFTKCAREARKLARSPEPQALESGL